MESFYYGGKWIIDNQWKYSPQNRRAQAIRSLVGEPCAFDMDGDKIINWREPEGKQPSDEDIETKVTEYKKLWDDQEYARKREAEYPSIAELTVALYDTDDKAAIQAKRAEIKKKYPKG